MTWRQHMGRAPRQQMCCRAASGRPSRHSCCTMSSRQSKQRRAVQHPWLSDQSEAQCSRAICTEHALRADVVPAAALLRWAWQTTGLKVQACRGVVLWLHVSSHSCIIKATSFCCNMCRRTAKIHTHTARGGACRTINVLAARHDGFHASLSVKLNLSKRGHVASFLITGAGSW